ncbi:MAG: hypothetical protein ND895_18120 [Pyrinomonadaceae bacterium]|nr:hypothetical protein [Pyrinomonadaceae bacterium]
MGFKKSTKILLGVVTIWPVAYIFLFMVGMLAMMVLMPFAAGPNSPQQPGSPLVPLAFVSFFAVHMLTILLSMGLMAFYIVRVFKTPLEEAMKIMWTVLICTVGIFAMPVFWYLYIWREPAVVPPGIAELGSAPASAFVNSTQSSARENEYYPPKPPDWR